MTAPRAIAIPEAVLAAVYAHARAAFPAECCGYLVGPRDGGIDAAVACTNVQAAEQALPGRGEDTAFAIGGAELLAFARSFDSPRPARVVYHSHPNGRAYFSEADRAMAASEAGPIYPVQHLVVGVTARGVVEAAQIAWAEAARDFVEVLRWRVLG